MIAERTELNRREWMARVLQTASGAALASRLGAQEDAAFLSGTQNDLLVSLGERILPGSKAASCNRVIDLILKIEQPRTQQQFVGALDAFDRQAKQSHGAGWIELRPEQQDEILTEACQENAPLIAQFNYVKEWLADAYWSSQEGLRELGWKGRMAWASFDGCPHAGAH